MSAQPDALLEHLFRREAGRMVTHLTRMLGPARLDLAEECVQTAMVRALETWPYQGTPENPGGWLFRVARNAALDAVRHHQMAGEKAEAIAAEMPRCSMPTPGDPDFEEQLRDDELRMIFMCCHPEIPRESRVALSLKTVGGFGVREIARAFLAEDAAIAQRLVRAKRQVRDQALTLEMPAPDEIGARVDAVLEAIYLMFNEGYTAHEGEELVRRGLCLEALRLGLLVAESQAASPRVHALVAMMALQAARLAARTDARGDLVLLENQDRNLWDRELLVLGFEHFDRAIAGEVLSGYHVQAAIAATHARAAAGGAVDWPVILELYDQLIAISASPVAALNRAVAVAKVRGAAVALAEVERLAADPKLRHYYLLLAVRGHLLLELGRFDEAAECYRAALELRCSEPERRFLRGKFARAVSSLHGA
ncbi:MAG TPA: sigma-70 family RNA polymerase sigma factor [Candidatus Solibacter sp.]|nr:sigma-70 family RNA polymerase sigma factor [Candidatus Solibacter sp.]